LEKFCNLTAIDLSHNRLSEVNKLPKGIKVLNLSNNRITSAKLARIPKTVTHLNISNNHITYVPYSLKLLKHLRSVELSGNPINCSCDTLEIRNWLTTKHVWTSRLVLCNAPLKFKGRPWLQVKQAEVCEVKLAPSKYNWDEIEGNELMQGDQAFEGSGDEESDLDPGYNYENDDEPQLNFANATWLPSEEDEEYDEDSSEASDGNVIIEEAFFSVSSSASTSPKYINDEEGSGGGIIPLDNVNIGFSTVNTDEASSTLNTERTLGTLGIFGNGIELPSSTTPISLFSNDIGEMSDDANEVETVAPSVNGEENADVKRASSDENRNTFILLGILGLLLVGLMIYVALKDKKSRKNRKSKRDIENTPAQELQDMVKPASQNGKLEISPLMHDDKNANGHDQFPALSPEKASEESVHEVPAFNSFRPTANEVQETNNNQPPVNGDTAEVHKELQPQPKRYSPVYSPRTPKLDRYSPVYTPEGRVKIKLTETPKPKTPIMVNRTRSRAGDYVITTPEINIDSVPNSQNYTYDQKNNQVTK
jgi:hypothetical protein